MTCSAHQQHSQRQVVSTALVLLFCLAIGASSDSQGGRHDLEILEGSSWKQRVKHNIDWRGTLSGDEAAYGTQSCSITDDNLAIKFTKVSKKLNLIDSHGDLCGAEDTMEERQPNIGTNQSLTCSSCDAIYDFIQQLLVDLNVTTYCCLGNSSVCGNGGRTATAKAYGYGFLMVLAVSLLSLLGVILLPVLNKNRGLYLYCNTLMIAMGTSALFCSAVLHLLPKTLMIAMGTSALFCSAVLHLLPKTLMLGESQKKAFIWKGIVIIAGLYLLYLFEVMLHSFSDHTHSHNNMLSDHKDTTSHPSEANHNGTKERSHPPSINGGAGGNGDRREHVSQTEEQNEESPLITKSKTSYGCCTCVIKPFAWIILFGDAFHNFADGLTVGAAISHSLSLGVSTTMAIAFHEIPHELGDFAILLSTGLPWYAALFLNFLSSLTAIIGFFVGVTIGTESVESTNWILTAAVGLFLYVALVDLLPELIHLSQKGCRRFYLILMANIGFFISLAVLLPIAVYEEKFDNLIKT